MIIAVVDARRHSQRGLIGETFSARAWRSAVSRRLSATAPCVMSPEYCRPGCRCGPPAWPPPPSVAGLTFVDWQQPIGCGGVGGLSNDVIVADHDGAVVIPAALIGEVVRSLRG